MEIYQHEIDVVIIWKYNWSLFTIEHHIMDFFIENWL